MIRRDWLVLSLVATLYLASPTASGGQQGRTITGKDLFDFVWVADPQVSPDGARVAFTRGGSRYMLTGFTATTTNWEKSHEEVQQAHRTQRIDQPCGGGKRGAALHRQCGRQDVSPPEQHVSAEKRRCDYQSGPKVRDPGKPVL